MISLAPAPNDGDRVRVEGSGEDAAGAANARLRVRPAPPREPPFDDERPRHLSLVGPHDRPLPFGAAAATDRSPAAGLTLHSVSTGLPDVAAFSRRFVIGVIETATGRRAPGQLARHTSPAVHAGLCQSAGRGTRLGTARRPATLHSIHVTEPLECVAEVAAVVRVGNRFRALALRLEGTDGRWRCVRLQVG
jgi:hypothetical protein